MPATKRRLFQTRRIKPEAKAAFRDEVVTIARALFAEAGFQNVTLRTIATKVGCTPMALYLYFPNKLSLLRYIWADIFRELFRQTEAEIGRNVSPSNRLRAYAKTWVDYWLDHTENYRVVFLNEDVRADKPVPQMTGMEQPFFANGEMATKHVEKLARVFAEGIAMGEFRKLPPRLCVEVAMTQLLGLVHALVIMPEFNWRPRATICKAAIDASIRGFMSDATASTAPKRRKSLSYRAGR